MKSCVLVLILDIYYRIYLMMDVLLPRFYVIRLRNVSGFCLQSASISYANAYRSTSSTCSPAASIYNGCLALYC